MFLFRPLPQEWGLYSISGLIKQEMESTIMAHSYILILATAAIIFCEFKKIA
jgi:hypothetical protein